jgi:proteic killer suppression protein
MSRRRCLKKHLVTITNKAEKDIRKIPKYLGLKLMKWQKTVELMGLEYTQTIPSYNDEKLKGKRIKQRSIRLNKGYRAIYEITKDTQEIRIIEIQEVNKHKY